MTNQIAFSSLEEMKQLTSSHFADSELENAIVHFLKSSGEESSQLCIEFLLTHESAKIRALGLRVVQRAVRNSSLLERVIQLSFEVGRLSELQHWYSAILARYSLSLFGERLCIEIFRRGDADFGARNVRALEMHRMSDIDQKKLVIERVRKCVAEAGISQPGSS
ncbi:hypothetical protein ABIC33_006755 [Variovorax sp. 1140]|uniref:hypothetical protein n=1 Tax=Variovorax atrisoli TaxID=3394203 RepID=UPI003393F27B